MSRAAFFFTFRVLSSLAHLRGDGDGDGDGQIQGLEDAIGPLAWETDDYVGPITLAFVMLLCSR